ncbi:MAG: TusE/DsrC/DsvC family sulfur relay protein [Candidatus Zixiibacteriota bacterium]|nr:MAG: TusE/DsrC/DsvC family sulfur relay protein [candidate division Zixibacteria bacterium]
MSEQKGAAVEVFEYKGRQYNINADGFLSEFSQWDENFAEALAPRIEIPDGLTGKHWDVIHYIHDSLKNNGVCPKVFETCRAIGLRVEELKQLFPTGYLRGACLLAGITYKNGYVGHSWLLTPAEDLIAFPYEKFYRVDVLGFLIDPDDWDRDFAIYKAAELKMPESLTDMHWQIIEFLRASYMSKRAIPTVYETCETNHITIEELERLFPDGYHRGAVKLAGLKVRKAGHPQK